jgi:spore coat polysaccharide biosynthesis predicted glycosyltransferase SpsG
MRLYAIAQEAISRNISSKFVGDIHEVNWLSEKIGKLGFSEVNNSTISNQTIKPQSILVLDSYSIPLDDPYINSSKWFRRILIADNLTPNYSCDLAIHTGIDTSWNNGRIKNLIGGPEYFPIRDEIKSEPNSAVDLLNDSIRILVTGGGTDPFNFNFEIANILMKLTTNFECIFISNQGDVIENMDSRFKVMQIGQSFEIELGTADIVFSTASTSSLEILAAGKVLAVCSLVDNQEELYKALSRLGLAQPIGRLTRERKWHLLGPEIAAVISNPALRKTILQKSIGFIDGKGAGRIIDRVLETH